MAFEKFKPIIWSAQILVGLKNKTVSVVGVNNNYQGEVSGSKAVTINTIGSVTLKDYTGADITYDDMTTTDQTLVIDHQKYFGLRFDDVDMAQVANGGELMKKSIAEAVDAIVQDRDQANFKVMADGAGVTVGTDEAPIEVTDYNSAKKLILKAKTYADKANVPREGRVLFIGSELENTLLADPTINLAQPTSETSLGAGHIGRLYGFNLFTSNNLPKTDGGNDVIIATHSMFTTEAIQVEKTEALRCQKTFKDLVRGLCVSGRKVIMPEGIVKVIVSYDEALA